MLKEEMKRRIERIDELERGIAAIENFITRRSLKSADGYDGAIVSLFRFVGSKGDHLSLDVTDIVQRMIGDEMMVHLVTAKLSSLKKNLMEVQS